MHSVRSSRFITVALAMALFFALPSFASAQPLAEEGKGAAPRYVAVIDAGSSGTRLTLFTRVNVRGIAPQEAYEASISTEGLSSFAESPSRAGPDAIKPLLDQLDIFTQAQGLAKGDVPVALLATAGLRTVRLSQPAAVQEILNSTRASLDASGYPILGNRILPAVMEGSLAWLDANVLSGTVENKKKNVGIIEIGGASAQVAFRARASKGPGIVTLAVNGSTVSVLSVSYLGLGSNLAREDMQERTGGGKICFPNNAAGAPPTTYDTDTATPVVSQEANFDLKECREAYSAVVTSVGSRRSPAARVAPTDLRSTPGFADSRFIGLGGASFSFSDFQIPSASSSRPALVSKVRSTCTGPNAWAKVISLSEDLVSPFADTACTNGTYVDALVFSRKGVGIAPKDFNGSPEFDGRSPSWPAGYATTVLHP